MHRIPETLAQSLAPAAVDFETLRARHGVFIQLGKRMLGIESNAYPLMEIWPTSFRTYNLLVPNFVNVPLPFLGFAPDIGLIGTAITMSSRAAECMYCSAHSCTIAMRGGANHQMLSSITDPGNHHTPGEAALARVAAGMSTVPASLTAEDVVALDEHYGAGAVDWLTHAIAMMGFLNKMMDSLGVDIEQALAEEVDEVARASGWTPGRHAVVDDGRPVFAPAGSPLRTLLAMAPYMLRAIVQDGRWTRGVPTRGDRAAVFLQGQCGYGFPMVAAIRQGRIVRSLATMLRDNLIADDSALGLGTKHCAGLVFAVGVGNGELERGSRAMAEAVGSNAAGVGTLDACMELGRVHLDLDDADAVQAALASFDDATGAALLLARAMSTSPSNMTPVVVERVSAALTPAQTVELMTWLSLLALLHRMQVLQEARAST